MNYYLEMIKDFVAKELQKEKGVLLDDGEFCYACGLAYCQIICRLFRKNKAQQIRQKLLEMDSMALLKAEMLAQLEFDEANKINLKIEEQHLINLVRNYVPKKLEIDSVLLEVMEEAMSDNSTVNKYARQEKYHKKVGIISKTYKLNQEVVDNFANACKKQGVSLGPTLSKLMQEFIDANLE